MPLIAYTFDGDSVVSEIRGRAVLGQRTRDLAIKVGTPPPPLPNPNTHCKAPTLRL